MSSILTLGSSPQRRFRVPEGCSPRRSGPVRARPGAFGNTCDVGQVGPAQRLQISWPRIRDVGRTRHGRAHRTITGECGHDARRRRWSVTSAHGAPGPAARLTGAPKRARRRYWERCVAAGCAAQTLQCGGCAADPRARAPGDAQRPCARLVADAAAQLPRATCHQPPGASSPGVRPSGSSGQRPDLRARLRLPGGDRLTATGARAEGFDDQQVPDPPALIRPLPG